VENLGEWTRAVADDELPYEEAMVRLYELRDRYGWPTAAQTVGSASERHYDLTGHRLSFGCCCQMRQLSADLASQNAELLAAARAERDEPAPGDTLRIPQRPPALRP
jgi:hypothetical protein